MVTVAVAGQVGIGPADLFAAGIQRAYALTDFEPNVARSIVGAPCLLEDIAAVVAAECLGATGLLRAEPVAD